MILLTLALLSSQWMACGWSGPSGRLVTRRVVGAGRPGRGPVSTPSTKETPAPVNPERKKCATLTHAQVQLSCAKCVFCPQLKETKIVYILFLSLYIWGCFFWYELNRCFLFHLFLM